MAESVLIDRYLVALRTELHRVAHAHEIVDEVCDHLLESFDRYLELGLPASAAEQRVLAEFGDTELIGRTFTKSQKAGAIVPTTVTRAAGIAAFAAAVLWIFAGLSFSIVGTDNDYWAIGASGSIATILAGLLTLITVAGLRRRLGGLNKARLGFAVFTAGALVSVFTWAVPVWMGLEGIGALLIAWAIAPLEVAPKLATRLFAVAFILGTVAYMTVVWAHIGPQDSYGDYELAGPTGFVIGAALFATAMFGFGRWLRSETPTDFDTPVAVA